MGKLRSDPPAATSRKEQRCEEAACWMCKAVPICSLPMQAFLLWDSPVAASIQEQYCESLLPTTNHTGECPVSSAHAQGTWWQGWPGEGEPLFGGENVLSLHCSPVLNTASAFCRVSVEAGGRCRAQES